MAKDAADLVAKINRLSTTLPRAHEQALSQASLAGKETMIRAAVGGGLKQGGNLPSSGRRKWGVNYKVTGSGANASALLRYLGPVHWQEGGTKAHAIVSKKAGRSRARRAAAAESGTGIRGAILTPQGPRARAQVAGIKARRFWAPAKALIIKTTPKTQSAANHRALLDAGFGK